MAVRHFYLLALVPLALTACGPKPAAQGNLDSLDAELAGNSANASDPAMRAALQDQIMVDPSLTGQSNADAVRPPQQPYSGAIPPDSVAGGKNDGTVTAGGSSSSGGSKPTPAPSGNCPQCKIKNDSVTLGALASRQGDKRTAGCARNLQYSTAWAQRLPADLPLYPDARVDEAAGAANGGCALRVVSFSTGASIQTVLDYYYGRATAAGYSAEHQADDGQHVLGGTRRDGAAYVIYLDTRGDGRTEVDIVANNGN
ncbi:hypothetical protein FPZ24_03440 [Sphingomonas panacisoli]|uniref:Uncharacterized protein n=1 Tax=Sphingomonas panacisoli TaxID=1813879 RepID=A0A5B8LG68_9SPHN|nr:hypothetical protein [Sphingomonas panacisoli]QDZ06642.1 hypothetical protein FPZ24_03440 [Sphingomonas panacisoli]